MRLRVGAATDTGRVRDLNEDAYMLRAADGLFVVCDGMGGGPAGEVASRTAIDAIAARIDAAPGRDAAVAGNGGYLPHTTRLVDAVQRSNAVVFAQSRSHPGRSGMATTVVGAWIRQQVASVAHVGDSRAYLWHAERLEQLTQDHALSGPYANMLVRVLGREPDVDVDVLEVPVRPGDYVLLCSDGLTRMVADRELAQAIGRLREPQRICDHLVATANSNGGRDNVTVVVVHVADSWWSRVLNSWHAVAMRGRDGETDAAV